MAQKEEVRMAEYKLPELEFPPDALEPHIDAKTVTIHHDKHHAAYVNGLNDALAKLEDARKKGDFANVQHLSRLVAFHGSGHALHTLYFANLSPKPGELSGELQRAVEGQFGGLDTLKNQLSAASNSAAGSGWGMLAYEPLGGRLLVLQIEKHENQMFTGAIPLLVIDVWEHAYYLKYQNVRADYVKAIWNVIDWKKVGKRFDEIKK